MKKKTTKKSALPVSTATNAYELLADVRRAILDEPKRYYQGGWRVRSKADMKREDIKELPACGTAACVAGWVVTLAGPKRIASHEIEDFAADILGFEAFDREYCDLVDGGAVRGNPQTMAYAKRGAAHIKRFMKAHEAQLKAKPVQAISQRGTR